jgi:cobyrinic acid a,c-diamide synthase
VTHTAARALVIAGVASGVGKTTLTLGLLEAYRRRGLRVQAFKVGPDFIDPGLHEIVTGRPSYNLDGWMGGREDVIRLVARHAEGADLLLIEGVMGCFDGVDVTSDAGSTAEIARWLAVPVVLVLDASAQSRSAAAVVLGFEHLDPQLRLGAVIANRVGGAAHGRGVSTAIGAVCRAVPVGALAHDPALTLAERHLGLLTAAEGVLTTERRARLADAVERAVDLDRLLALAAPITTAHHDPAERPMTTRARIGIARDAAFQFYYADNLDRLRAAGAELIWWSPLADPDLPDVDGLYLGGGYPELHAARLAANRSMLKAIRRFAEAGRPIYAECGGLMLLAESIQDVEGVGHAMVGLLPARVRMLPRSLTIGYREVVLSTDCPLGPAGVRARGQEFHASTLDPVPAGVPRAYQVRRRNIVGNGDEPPHGEGYLIDRALASYVHLQFASSPGLASAFVDACAAKGQ